MTYFLKLKLGNGSFLNSLELLVGRGLLYQWCEVCLTGVKQKRTPSLMTIPIGGLQESNGSFSSLEKLSG